MPSYRNEAAFSKALVSIMRRRGWFVQRIESGETGKGIPDIYAITPACVPMWLELKRERGLLLQSEYVEIHWRPGQQSWLHDVVSRKQLAYTIACFDNGLLSIPHHNIWPENRVLLSLCEYSRDISDLLR